MDGIERTVFSERLVKLRKDAGITQEQLSGELHLSRSTYTCYEIGKTAPSLTTLVEIARILNVSVDYLLGAENNQYSTVREISMPLDDQLLLKYFHLLSSQKQKALIEFLKKD